MSTGEMGHDSICSRRLRVLTVQPIQNELATGVRMKFKRTSYKLSKSKPLEDSQAFMAYLWGSRI
jgi:hypothetical protein